MTISFTSVAVVAVVALVAPLAVGFTGLRLPAIVVEILLGIVVGPQVLGWASNDEPVQVLGLIGLAFLLLLAGLEIDFDRLHGRLLRLTGLGYLLSFGLALVVGYGLRADDLVSSPLLDVAPPFVFWGKEEVAIDLFHHAVYAAATGLVYEGLD